MTDIVRYTGTEISTVEDYAGAGVLLARIRDYCDKIETERKDATKDFRDGIAKLNAKFKGLLEEWETEGKRIEGMMLAFLSREEDRAEEVVASEANEWAQKGALQLASDIRQSARDSARFSPDGVKVKRRWTFEVVDPSLVPREFLVVDEAALRKHATKGVEIPGVRFFQVTEFSR